MSITPRFPNESEEYRTARDQLLEAEDELLVATTRVAEQRRKLPLGGAIKEEYVFDRIGAGGQKEQVHMSELFAPDKNTLFVYGFMYGPDMEKPCPMCTAFTDGLNGNAEHIQQRINLAVIARSDIDRIMRFAKTREWKLPLLSSVANTYQYDYFSESPEGGQLPMVNVFVKKDGAVHHWWGSELLFTPREGMDSRHVDTFWPLWNVLDVTPEGRGSEWYPSLSYE